jgi:hypothetical protein
VFGQGLLRFNHGRHSFRRPGKGNEEGITFGVDLPAVPFGENPSHYPVVVGQQADVFLAKFI